MRPTTFPPRLAAAALVVLAFAPSAGPQARAGELFHKLFHHHRHDEPPRGRPTPEPGCPRYFEHTHERAGMPLCVSGHAIPTNTPEYVGYYVGGGSCHGGDARCFEEGTFGWDYRGWHLPRRIFLGWNHGRRYQNGTGAYATDGPPVPDVVFATTTTLRHLD
jgi:hypothetical protein